MQVSENPVLRESCLPLDCLDDSISVTDVVGSHLTGLDAGAANDSGTPHFRQIESCFRGIRWISIELDTRNGTLVTPRSRSTGLQDCSDRTQVCLTDHRGFAFAYFRKYDDATTEGYRSLRFPPKVVTVVDNNDVWMVYDAAPNTYSTTHTLGGSWDLSWANAVV